MAPTLLFVPVSGAFGMGEYARCLNLAQAYCARRPDARIHFVLSEQARYAAGIPFEATRVPSSPTFHTREVIAVIDRIRPDVVIFDNAGRSAQLAAARRSGAKIVYVSARPRQRSRAFRVRWMRMLDEHWIAYPEFIAGALTLLERAKLKWCKRPRVRFLDCLLPKIAADEEAALLAAAGTEAGRYLLVVPGGGTGHRGSRDAAEIFLNASREIAARGFQVVFVAPAAVWNRGSHDGTPICLDLLPLGKLLALIRGARAVLTNGGGTLIQSIACHAATISVPIAPDQPARIARCAARGLTVRSTLDVQSMARAALELLEDQGSRERLQNAARAILLQDASQVAADALDLILRQ